MRIVMDVLLYLVKVHAFPSCPASAKLDGGLQGFFSPPLCWSVVSSPDLCSGLGTQGATEGVYSPCTECQDNLLFLSEYIERIESTTPS